MLNDIFKQLGDAKLPLVNALAKTHTVVNTHGKRGHYSVIKTTENWRFILSTKLHTWHDTGEYTSIGACCTLRQQ